MYSDKMMDGWLSLLIIGFILAGILGFGIGEGIIWLYHHLSISFK